MEFTEKEIEMFGKAKELQADWRPQRGDWFYKVGWISEGMWLICVITGGTLWCAGEGMKIWEFKNRLVEFRVPENYIWIPSIERLQEMVWDSWDDIAKMHLLCCFKDYAQSLYDKDGKFASMKQLWLRLVMRERYQRRWDGKSWRKLEKPKTEPAVSEKE